MDKIVVNNYNKVDLIKLNKEDLEFLRMLERLRMANTALWEDSKGNLFIGFDDPNQIDEFHDILLPVEAVFDGNKFSLREKSQEM